MKNKCIEGEGDRGRCGDSKLFVYSANDDWAQIGQIVCFCSVYAQHLYLKIVIERDYESGERFFTPSISNDGIRCEFCVQHFVKGWCWGTLNL